MAFTVGQKYSRRQISAQLGGGVVTYLPRKGGIVLCGCFRRDAEFNPDAPNVVTFGPGPIVMQCAEQVARQKGAIPVFVADADDEGWAYHGMYTCERLATDPQLLRDEEQKNPRRGPIRGVLYFKPAA